MKKKKKSKWARKDARCGFFVCVVCSCFLTTRKKARRILMERNMKPRKLIRTASEKPLYKGKECERRQDTILKRYSRRKEGKKEITEVLTLEVQVSALLSTSEVKCPKGRPILQFFATDVRTQIAFLSPKGQRLLVESWVSL